jgi:hypothetical protein
MDAANESGNFILANLHIMQPGNGIAAMSANASNDCRIDLFGTGTFRLENAGVFLDGLSVLPEDMKLNDTMVKQM